MFYLLYNTEDLRGTLVFNGLMHLFQTQCLKRSLLTL